MSEPIISNKPIFTIDDFVVNKDSDGTIQSGGYRVENYFMSGGMPIMKTTNSKKRQNESKNKDSNFSDIFKDLAVPAGLLYVKAPTSMFEPTVSYDRKSIDEDDVVEESLYDRLLKLAQDNEENIKKQKKTRRGTIVKHNKTKRRNN